MKQLEAVSVSFSDGRAKAKADGATKLVVPTETRARFDVAPPSADVETSKLQLGERRKRRRDLPPRGLDLRRAAW